jgi:predicted CoA-binding protein
MKDPLEDFIQQNRAGFDDKEPSKKIWRGIEKAMSFETHRLWDSILLWRAAAIVFMALSGYLLIPENRDRSKTVDASLNEFKDVEAFYVKQISEKVGMIDEFQKSDGLNGFTQDFQRLEAMYMVLQDEMKSDPSKQVQEAMVLNLLVRIDLLNQQLYKLDKEYPKKEKGSDDSV